MLDFDVVLEKDKETGQIYASVPTLPGCYSYGDTVEEALKNIKEAIELHVEGMKESKTKVTTSVIGLVKVAIC